MLQANIILMGDKSRLLKQILNRYVYLSALRILPHCVKLYQRIQCACLLQQIDSWYTIYIKATQMGVLCKSLEIDGF